MKRRGNKMSINQAECYADSARGIYIPQYVAETIKRDRIKYFDSWADLEAGPESESYWNSWTEFLDNAETDCGGKFWQDGDLWIIWPDLAIEAVNEFCQAQLEYEESHKDSGDNYSHMPAESWTNTEDKMLAEWVESENIDSMGLDTDQLSNIALDCFYMRSGHIFGPYHKQESDLILAAYPLQEIEIDLSCLGLDGITLDYIENSCDAYIKKELAYMTTDSVWHAVLTKSAFQDAIKAIKGE
jgi:hypothetical protein